MEKKPSLTLELDSHVADAGLETRIEAFLDIVRRHRELEGRVHVAASRETFTPATVTGDHGRPRFIDSQGRSYALSDDRVHVLFPSMCRFISEIGSAAFRGFGVRSSALPPADDEVLKIGRGHTSCKECLPLLLTTGGLLHYLDTGKAGDEKLIYFMPTASGPCRFGQYSRFLSGLITKLRIEDVALFSLSAENSYAGFGGEGLSAVLWQGVLLADIFEEIYSVLLTNAADTGSAVHVFEECWRRIIMTVENPAERDRLPRILESIAGRLKSIPVVRSLQDTPVILLAGEIYVRHDDLSGSTSWKSLQPEDLPPRSRPLPNGFTIPDGVCDGSGDGDPWTARKTGPSLQNGLYEKAGKNHTGGVSRVGTLFVRLRGRRSRTVPYHPPDETRAGGRGHIDHRNLDQ